MKKNELEPGRNYFRVCCYKEDEFFEELDDAINFAVDFASRYYQRTAVYFDNFIIGEMVPGPKMDYLMGIGLRPRYVWRDCYLTTEKMTEAEAARAARAR